MLTAPYVVAATPESPYVPNTCLAFVLLNAAVDNVPPVDVVNVVDPIVVEPNLCLIILSSDDDVHVALQNVLRLLPMLIELAGKVIFTKVISVPVGVTKALFDPTAATRVPVGV